jgi:long-chain acyl-CoA synthetase
MSITTSIHRNLRMQPGGIATIFGDRRLDWRAHAERVARAATVLRSLGARADARVAVLAENSDRYLEIMFATAWAGGVLVPLNHRWSVPELADAMTDCGAAVLVTDATHQGRREEIAARIGREIATLYLDDGAVPAGCTAYPAALASAAPAADADRAGAALASIYYTGGTTGRSKGVMLTHAGHEFHSVAFLAGVGMGPEAVYLHVAPMFHVADGLFSYAATCAGARHVVLPRFDVTALLQAIERHRITDTILVPTMINALVNAPEFAEFDVSSLRRLFYGASPMPEALLRKTMERLPRCALTQLYGQTEAGPVVTILHGHEHVLDGPEAVRLRSAGRAMPGVDVRIFDADDHEVPRGTVGEIVCRGPNVMQGYWQRPEETARALRGGWLHTGDAGRMDEHGFIYVSDRLKDMIISGGENVYSVEVENAIYQHPGVYQCAVIGVPDERWVERVHAIVVPMPGVEIRADALIDHCKGLIAGYKCPRSVEIRTAPLPLSGAGKILKSELRKAYQPCD